MVDENHISINGPWLSSHPNIVTAVDLDSGSLLVVKLLPTASQQQKDAAQSEKRAVNLLKLDTAPVHSALVPTQIHSVKVSSEHAKTLQLEAGSYDALKMPWYTASLQHLPQLSHELLWIGGRRLQQAVTAMHEVKLLHTDLKSSQRVCRFFWGLVPWGLWSFQYLWKQDQLLHRGNVLHCYLIAS